MRDYLSYSQIRMFLGCGQQYYYRYIEDKILPPKIAMIKGKAVHKGIEINGKHKMAQGSDLPKSDIIDCAITDLNAQAQEDFILNDEEQATGKSKVIGQIKDSIVNIAGLYADEVAPTIQPIAVEENITIEIPDSKPILAILDCVDDKKVVHDFKVTGKSKPQSEADNSLQLTIYALAHKEKYGEMPNGLTLDTLVELKTPKYQRLETTRENDSFVKVFRISQAINKAIQSGVFLPAAESAWQCSKTWCGYYDQCPYVQSSIF